MLKDVLEDRYCRRLPGLQEIGKVLEVLKQDLVQGWGCAMNGCQSLTVTSSSSSAGVWVGSRVGSSYPEPE